MTKGQLEEHSFEAWEGRSWRLVEEERPGLTLNVSEVRGLGLVPELEVEPWG